MVKPTRTTPVQKENFVTKYPYTADDVGKVKVIMLKLSYHNLKKKLWQLNGILIGKQD